MNAFKKLNDHWIKDIINKIPTDHLIHDIHKNNELFSDMSIQIHYGDAVKEKNVGWHYDSPNSALHLALSIKNKRALYVGGSDSPNGEYKKFATVMEPGDVYFSTPSNILHGVEYPTVKKYDDRIIAVQCRILVCGDEDEFDKFLKKTDWTILAKAVSEVCCQEIFKVVLPTMKDIE